MKNLKSKSKWFWFLLFFIVGMGFVIWGLIDMYAFEVQENHETLKEVMVDARRATRGQWLPGIVILLMCYVQLYLPKFNK